jgi:hypothetical protein
MLRRAYKIIRQPRRALRYLTTSISGALFWESRYRSLREPKLRGALPHDPGVQRAVRRELEGLGLDVRDMVIDLADYRRYLERAGYGRFPTYYGGGEWAGFAEKALEHYLAAKLLDLRDTDVYIDVASYDSPTPDVYRRVYGCATYRQDLLYPAGMHGDRIGGDAARLPVPGGFATRMALHNAFEHFEGDSDQGLIREAGRVLASGGKLCIVPLFLFDRYIIQTDPSVWPAAGVPFEPDATVYCARGWRNRFGRAYDVPHLASRICANLGGLRLSVFVVANEHEVDPDCYVKFIGLFEKA